MITKMTIVMMVLMMTTKMTAVVVMMTMTNMTWVMVINDDENDNDEK